MHVLTVGKLKFVCSAPFLMNPSTFNIVRNILYGKDRIFFVKNVFSLKIILLSGIYAHIV